MVKTDILKLTNLLDIDVIKGRWVLFEAKWFICRGLEKTEKLR